MHTHGAKLSSRAATICGITSVLPNSSAMVAKRARRANDPPQ
jgi:hypothetical protein